LTSNELYVCDDYELGSMQCDIVYVPEDMQDLHQQLRHSCHHHRSWPAEGAARWSTCSIWHHLRSLMRQRDTDPAIIASSSGVQWYIVSEVVVHGSLSFRNDCWKLTLVKLYGGARVKGTL